MTMSVALPVGPSTNRFKRGWLRSAAGIYYVGDSLADPHPFCERWRFSDIQVAIYLITDTNDRVRWLGQANRNKGLAARLHDHARYRDRLQVFSNVYYLQLADDTPSHIQDVIEGRCADTLALRDAMAPRRWPRSTDWVEHVHPRSSEK